MQRIAIVGSGIAGLGAAWLLDGHADITVFEAAARAGGHTHTVMAGVQPVDTGFIVLNDRNYPFFQRFLAELDVPTQASNMSFGVSIGQGKDNRAIEWAGDSWRTLFAQKSLLADPAHWRMIRDIVRFNRQGKALLGADALPRQSLGDFLDDNDYSEAFAARYLLPMAAAIWSTPTAGMRAFPLGTFLQFFDNHGLLDLRNRPQWRTVTGGSQRYVQAMAEILGSRLRLSTPVERVTRDETGVTIDIGDGEPLAFDQVIFACHADQSRHILVDADTDEKNVLSAFAFQPNRAVLHNDATLMPRRRSVWSSWNYQADRAVLSDQRVAVTYWMNRLQAIGGDTDYFVSLNPLAEPDPALMIREIEYDHPIFDAGAIDAQQRLPTIQGRNGTWYCGAWCGHGFHEDGLAAATRVAAGLGVTAPWSQ